MAEQDDERRRELEALLAQYQRNLAHLRQQAASYGGEPAAPLSVMNALALTRAEIAQVKASLQKLAPRPQSIQQPISPAPLPSMPAASVVVGALRLTIELQAGKWMASVENIGQQGLTSLRLKIERPSTLYINPDLLEIPRLAAGARFERELTITCRGGASTVQLPLVATYFPSDNPPRQQGTLTLVLPEK